MARAYENTRGPGNVALGRKNVLQRLKELCDEQGVDPNATLTPEDIKKWMNITHAEKNMIQLIATGFPVRNAQTVIKAIELKLDRSTPKAQSTNPEREPISITIKTENGPMPATIAAALPRQQITTTTTADDLDEDDFDA